MKISVLINTLNEEGNIKNCLESVKWADEIILVDMYSEDRTVEIAKEYTEKIYYHDRMGYVEPARKFALDKASNQWVLVIDADEMVPLALRNKLYEIMSSDKYDAVLIPHRNYFFGYPMSGTGWGPLQDMHIRFFRKDTVRFSNRIHAFIELSPGARLYKIKEEELSFIHFNYIDVEHFLEKLNRYTTIEAKNAVSAGESFFWPRFFYSVLKEFGVRYIVNKGYRDGLQGFVLAFLMSAYRVAAGYKHFLLQKHNTTDRINSDVMRQYQKIAEEILQEYDSKMKG